MRTVVLTLKRGGDFSFRDVELIARKINEKWKDGHPHIICLWDGCYCDLGNIELIPLNNNYQGTWARMMIYSPEMEKYRPFLYVDLDTAIIQSLENIFELVKNPDMFIPLEDFYQRGQLATGLAWIPANSEKVKNVWNSYNGESGWRMDSFLRRVIKPDAFWQQLTDTIIDFKPKNGSLLQQVPENANLVCFHGKPRIFDCDIDWVRQYRDFKPSRGKKKITVVIPYKIDRGWLKEAINSVPKDCQLLVSQGEGNWPENFNKVLDQAEGDYIRWLHEDDMLTPNSIEDSVRAIEEQEVDFIHGNAIEFFNDSDRIIYFKPQVKIPTIQDMLKKNPIHSATLMYKREVFEKLRLDETLNTAEEYEFNLRVLKNGFKIGYCATNLAFYRRHPEQKVRIVSKEAKSKEREMVKDMYR
jgi:hypothetical protein